MKKRLRGETRAGRFWVECSSGTAEKKMEIPVQDEKGKNRAGGKEAVAITTTTGCTATKMIK